LARKIIEVFWDTLNQQYKKIPESAVWDTTTGQQLCDFHGKTGYFDSHVCFSPDGKLLAMAAANGQVTLWDVEAKKQVKEWQFPGTVNSIVFSPDGRHLITGNANGTLYVFRLAPLTATAQNKPL
jgi:WD40 repeat protein